MKKKHSNAKLCVKSICKASYKIFGKCLTKSVVFKVTVKYV